MDMKNWPQNLGDPWKGGVKNLRDFQVYVIFEYSWFSYYVWKKDLSNSISPCSAKIPIFSACSVLTHRFQEKLEKADENSSHKFWNKHFIGMSFVVKTRSLSHVLILAEHDVWLYNVFFCPPPCDSSASNWNFWWSGQRVEILPV